MAHYLSNVTLTKLDQRREDVDYNAAAHRAGIEASRDVFGFFRCIAPAWMTVTANTHHRAPQHFRQVELGDSNADNENDSGAHAAALQHVTSGASYTSAASIHNPTVHTVNKVPTMWCGEQDGRLSVRDFTSGDIVLMIDAKPKVFVFALLDVSLGVVWAGLSDGFIRVFDSFSYRLIDEVRAHCGAVTAMALASMPSLAAGTGGVEKKAVAITASNDWTIAVWDVIALHHATDPFRRKGLCLCRLNAHQNAVRSLAVDKRGGSTRFVSGGDDGAIRLWDLEKFAVESQGYSDEWDDPGATRVAGTAGHRKSFRNATLLAAVDTGSWPVEGAHKGAVTALLFCGDSEAEVETVKRRRATSDVAHANNRGRSGSRTDLVANVADNLTATARARAAALVAQEPRYNKFVVSAGHDGAVRLWNHATAVLLLEVEIRPCPVTSLLLDPIHGRVWAGGVDSVITVYDEHTFDHVVSLHDHSGSYVVNFHAVPGLATSNAWILDATGRVTAIRVGPQAEDDSMLQEELEQYEVIDGLRSTVIGNFELLQDLRHETQQLTGIDARRKKHLAIVLGDNMALRQRYIVNTNRYQFVRRSLRTLTTLSRWLGCLNGSSMHRRYFCMWRDFGLAARSRKVSDLLSNALRDARGQKLRRRYLHLLHEAALHKDLQQRLQDAAARLQMSTSRSRMQSMFYAWLRFHQRARENKARLIVAQVINRSSHEVVIADFWARLVAAANVTEAKRKRDAAIKLLRRASGAGMLHVYFHKWHDARPYLKAARTQRGSVSVLAAALARRLRVDSLRRWSAWIALRRMQRDEVAAANARRERDDWEAVINSSSELNRGALDARSTRLDERAAERRKQAAANEVRLHELQSQINALHRRKFMSTMNVDENASLQEQSNAIINLVKARGVNCGYDAATIERARNHCLAIDRGDLVPEPLTKSESSYSRTATATSTSAAPPAPASPTTAEAAQSTSASPAARRQRAASTTSPRPASPSSNPSTPRQSAAAAKPPLDASLQRALRLVKQRLFDLARREGYRHVPATAEVRGTLAEQDPDVAEADSPARHDWAIPMNLIESIRPKDHREIITAVKEFVIAYDYSNNSVSAAALQQASVAPLSPRLAAAIGTPAPAEIRPGLLREFMYNSHVFLILVQTEYDKAVKQGVTAGDDYKEPGPSPSDAAAGNKTPRGGAASGPTAGSYTRSVAGSSGIGQSSAQERAAATTAPGTPRGEPTLTRGQRLRAQSVKGQQEAAARLEQIMEDKKVKQVTTADLKRQALEATSGQQRLKPYMGFRVESSTTRQGTVVKVAAVAEGSPAEAAGMKVGDILVRFANYKITDLPAFNALVSRYCLLDKVIPAKLNRGADTLEVNINVAGRF